MILQAGPEEVLVGTAGEEDPHLLSALKLHHRKEVRFIRLDPVEFASWLGTITGKSSLEGLGGGVEEERILLDRMANDAPVVNYVNSLILEAMKASASDIHIERMDDEALVRFRLDGALVEAARFPAERFQAVSSRLKIMANLNIMETRLPQDGRIGADLGGERLDLRVSIVPITRGESIVLRLLGARSGLPELDKLGMDPETLSLAEGLLTHPHGLVLLTGPTGSGKTTTLSAMLRRLDSGSLKIITIEDPIEYRLPGICQIQTNEGIGLSFDGILRRILRQDPDVVMVGEIRDRDTADLVLRAALTGHLVLSTLHTNDVVSSVSRLKDMGAEPFLIGAVLRGAMAQRLLRRLCPHCATKRAATTAERDIGARAGIRIETLSQPKGCPKCRMTGYSGRIPIFESFKSDDEVEALISTGAEAGTLRKKLKARGLRDLAAYALQEVAAGRTSLEEARREVELQ
jgi:general secretion pathway protein E/type IV pilus assembly protein PilB